MQVIGRYLIIAGTILGMFPNLAAIGAMLITIGEGLEQGQTTIGPVFIGGNLQTVGKDLAIAGEILSLFGGVAAQVGTVLAELGAGLEAGNGTVGPIRIGGFGLSFSFVPATGKEGIELTVTVGPWSG